MADLLKDGVFLLFLVACLALFPSFRKAGKLFYGNPTSLTEHWAMIGAVIGGLVLVLFLNWPFIRALREWLLP